MNIETVITDVIRDVVAQRQGEAPEVLAHDLLLVEDLGIRSLDLAQVVAVLESRLGTDPFATGVSITGIRTVGDLCRAYRRSETSETDGGAAPREGAERAAARLRAASRRRAEPVAAGRRD